MIVNWVRMTLLATRADIARTDTHYCVRCYPVKPILDILEMNIFTNRGETDPPFI